MRFFVFWRIFKREIAIKTAEIALECLVNRVVLWKIPLEETLNIREMR